jgi:hypothetical protein
MIAAPLPLLFRTHVLPRTLPRPRAERNPKPDLRLTQSYAIEFAVQHPLEPGGFGRKIGDQLRHSGPLRAQNPSFNCMPVPIDPACPCGC